MTQEALKLALEALELCNGAETVEGVVIYTDKAITAIKEALAQPEQEPVGQLLEDAFGRGQVMWFNKPKDESMLYTTTPQRKPQIWEHEGYDALCQELELWKAEAQRKPLTDEEIQNILPDDGTPMSLGEAFVKFARAIEAAHGIKGEA